MFRSTAIVAAALLAFSGCTGLSNRPDTGTGIDYTAMVSGALLAGTSAMDVVSSLYLNAGNWTGCVAASATRSAFEAAAASVDTPTTIPTIEVDVSACLAVRSPKWEAPETDEELRAVSTALAQSLLSVTALVVDRTADAPGQCRARAISTTVITYVSGITDPVVSEILAPDGVLTLPGVSFDFTACGETTAAE